jgi:hypothetical protein
MLKMDSNLMGSSSFGDTTHKGCVGARVILYFLEMCYGVFSCSSEKFQGKLPSSDILHSTLPSMVINGLETVTKSGLFQLQAGIILCYPGNSP